MNSNLPERVPPQHTGARGETRTFVYQFSSSGRSGGLGGLVLGMLVAVALLAFLVLGAITITLALWIACGVVVFGILAALVRALFAGKGDGPRGPGPA